MTYFSLDQSRAIARAPKLIRFTDFRLWHKILMTLVQILGSHPSKLHAVLANRYLNEHVLSGGAPHREQFKSLQQYDKTNAG